MLVPQARALRAAGVPTKFLALRALPRRPIAYASVLRAQHRRRTGEDANVVISWPRTGFVAFDARVPAPEEDAAWQASRRRLARSLGSGMAFLARWLADEDRVTGGSQPTQGPVTVAGPQGPVSARACFFDDIVVTDTPCKSAVSEVAVTTGFDLRMRVTVSASCVSGAGPYEVSVFFPRGFSDLVETEGGPVVCTGNPPPDAPSYIEERRFETLGTINPGPRSYNAPWQLSVFARALTLGESAFPVAEGESSLQILRRDYSPASSRTITERNRDDFFNVCLDGHHTVRSLGGVLYCVDYLSAFSDVSVRSAA